MLYEDSAAADGAASNMMYHIQQYDVDQV